MSDRRSAALVLAILMLPFAASGETPLDPISLRRAVEMALARAPEVAVARAEADLAGASARLARAHLGPEAVASTNPGYTTGLPVMVAGQVPSLFNLSIRQSIYDASLRAGALTARAEAEDRQAGLERASAETARAVVLAYGRVAADASRVAGARRSLEAQEAISRRVSSLAREGRATPLDADTAGLEVARAKQRLLDRTFARELDELELRRLLDWPAGATLTVADDPLAGLPPPPPSGNVDAGRRADPERRALEREIESLRSAATARSRKFQPRILAEAQYLRLARYNNFEDYFRRFKENDFSIGVSISIPIWASGQTREAAAEAQARLNRAEAAMRGRGRDIELSVRRAEADLARAGAQEGVARSAEALARERVRVATALASEGRREGDGAEQAEIALARAQEELADAVQAVVAARVSLLVLRGEWPGRLSSVP